MTLTEQQKAEGWIEHLRAPESPVGKDTYVEVMWTTGGRVSSGWASVFEWRDIIAYREPKP